MISNLEKEITFRYLKTRKKDGFLNIITIFSFIGISLGVAVLIIVMSVMNGFRSDLIKKINGFNSHATIQSYDGLFNLKKIDNSNLKSQIDGFLISNNGEGIIINEKITKGVLLRGYKKDEFQSLNIVKNKDFSGSKTLDKDEISISREMGYDLDLKIGDKLSLVFSSFEETLVGSLPKQKTFKIISFYNSGFGDFDKNIAFVNIEDLENQLNLKPDSRFLEIYFKDPTDIVKIKKDLIKLFPTFSFELEIRFTNALPIITPSAPQSRTLLTCSGVDIPKPTAIGLVLTSFNLAIRFSTLFSILFLSPVTPVTLTK